jgi:GNAT superfamily N-acetyltransferase
MGSHNENVTFKEYKPEQVAPISKELGSLYGDVYAEPPYYETKSDVTDFASRLASQVQEPSFRLIAAWDKDDLVGYIYGFAIKNGSPLWATVFLSPEPGYDVHEWIDPVTFVSELLVAASHRRHGIARALHDRFIATRSEPRAVLLAHPEATAAQAAYARWGWYQIGSGRPWPNTPLYDTLVKDLHNS